MLPETSKPNIVTTVLERVVEVRITRPTDAIAGPVVEVDVAVMEGEFPRQRKTFKLSDVEREALWASTAQLTFRNWIFNQIVPNADTLVRQVP